MKSPPEVQPNGLKHVLRASCSYIDEQDKEMPPVSNVYTEISDLEDDATLLAAGIAQGVGVCLCVSVCVCVCVCVCVSMCCHTILLR